LDFFTLRLEDSEIGLKTNQEQLNLVIKQLETVSLIGGGQPQMFLAQKFERPSYKAPNSMFPRGLGTASISRAVSRQTANLLGVTTITGQQSTLA